MPRLVHRCTLRAAAIAVAGGGVGGAASNGDTGAAALPLPSAAFQGHPFAIEGKGMSKTIGEGLTSLAPLRVL